MKKPNKTDCRTKEGIVVGLIDGLISICRVLSPQLKELEKSNGGEFGQPTIEALMDLTQDEDVLSVLRSISSRHIISEEQAYVWEKIIEGMKKPTK